MILPLAALLMVACGEKKDEKKSICDCMKEAMKGVVEEAPAGCEWMDKLTEAEQEKEMMSAMKDCPDMMGYFMLGEDEVELEDMPAQAIENYEDVMDDTGDDSWEEALDEYEDYVDSYVSIMKKMKANPTDMSILEDYTELAEAAQEWASKMDNISQNFGPNELNRMMKIQAKITKALSSY